MSEKNEYNIKILENEHKVNINMRVKQSLREKIKDKMDKENKNPDDFFSDMFYSYLKIDAKHNGDIDYTSDLEDLENVTKRIITIYKNMVEKSYMQNSISKENHLKEIAMLQKTLKEDYEKNIDKVNKDNEKIKQENEKIKHEYELISLEATKLLEDAKELRDCYNLVKNTNYKNEELILNYKEQIEALKSSNKVLEKNLENTIDKSILEQANFQKEKDLLELDKHYQTIIKDMNDKYNKLQINFSEQLVAIHNGKNNTK